MSSQESVMNIRRIQEQRYKMAMYYQRFKNINKNNSHPIRQVQFIKKSTNKNGLSHDDKEVLDIQKKFIDKLQGLSVTERNTQLENLKVIHVFNGIHNYSERVELLENYIVKKKISFNRLGLHLFQNEVNSLLKLTNCSHIPQILGFNPKRMEIYMTYCGKELTRQTLPKDWKVQFKNISEIFIQNKIHSNDMIIRNTTVLDGKLYIIDFGLNNQFKEDINIVLRNFYYRLLEFERKTR